MRIVGTQIHEELDGRGYIVEFVVDGGDVVSVQFARADSQLGRDSSVDHARRLLRELVTAEGFDGSDARRASPSPAVQSLQQESEQADPEGGLEKGLEDTFPASDPVSVTQPTGATLK